jgi:hypothetical protein
LTSFHPQQPEQSGKLAELKKALAAEQKRYGDKITPPEISVPK